jgi:hypothetical protein
LRMTGAWDESPNGSRGCGGISGSADMFRREL